MKRLYVSAALGLLLTGTSHAASPASLNQFPNHALPVLVSVNASGKVTGALPATELPGKLGQLLQRNLDELITGPATEHGHPVSSQCIINLAVESVLREDGDYDVRFVYVSSKPVPSGAWHWADLDGHQLALVSNRSAGSEHSMDFVPSRYDGGHRIHSQSGAGTGHPQSGMPAISAPHASSNVSPSTSSHGSR